MVLLAVALRSVTRLARVLLTLALTVAIVIAVLHASGERLHLLHLVGMLLVVAVGSNYALFFDRVAFRLGLCLDGFIGRKLLPGRQSTRKRLYIDTATCRRGKGLARTISGGRVGNILINV